MTEYLRLLASGGMDVKPLVQGVFPIERAEEAYTALQSPDKPMILLLDYGSDAPLMGTPPIRIQPIAIPGVAHTAKGPVRVAVVGAGGYAQGMHLPNLKKLNDLFTLRAVCSRTGTKAQAVALQYEAAYSTTDYAAILADPDIDLVILCTRHDLHGTQTLEALRAGKHVLVEKPLCLTQEELHAIEAFYAEKEADVPLLTVGFNRRFSPYLSAVRALTTNRTSPLFIRYRMNAGYLPPDHWTHGPEGGGRIVGEACHIIDAARSLVGAAATSFSTASLHPRSESYTTADNKIISLEYEDGSVACLEYFAIGAKELPKEWLEVHYDGKSLIVDNFQSLTGYGVTVPPLTNASPDKGQFDFFKAVGKALTQPGSPWPIPLAELLETTGITFATREGR